MKEQLLRELIATILLEEVDEEILGEPDFVDERPLRKKKLKGRKSEVSAIGIGGGSPQSAGTMRGVTTPLGRGPTYPVPRVKKPKKKRRKK